ncbi:hypothetical protein K490DRAFT_69489 [Saccharata proteae CBS 121410]|uniref:Tetratricopeptide SHNi-TPR domain-containing protein n=1 Tax=Saccharata proteae CBS 121410 TaxID=1314787 RepID=A0A9P4HLD7_9PEZI|nr:hypothetical protein K490DRAFT_69489 [Saccharata proteae CBS 121410]
MQTVPEDTPLPDKLSELVAAANLQYSLKNYDAASEIYSRAAELQDEQNGEMAPENGELLYLYGRCLYQVAIAKSDVLGGRVASEEKPKKKSKGTSASADKSKTEDVLPDAEQKTADEVVEAAGDEKKPETKEESAENKPYFQIIGDDNWDTESEDADGAEDGEQAAEDEDDLAIAYEILDSARVLLTRQLEAIQNTPKDVSGTGKGKGKESATSETLDPEERKLMERLADTQDIQAEIGLENEVFAEAVTDFRSSLELKQKIYPKESELIAEAHYKLSLALEFESMKAVREAQAAAEASGGNVKEGDAKVDEAMRADAAKQMELAIESCKLRMAKEEKALPSATGDAAEKVQKQLQDVKELVEDMENRLTELRGPAITLTQPDKTGAFDPTNPLATIVQELLGGQAPAKEKAEQKAKIEGASDISGLVKRKKPAAAAAASTEEQKSLEAGGSASLKRKSEAPEDEREEKKSKN